MSSLDSIPLSDRLYPFRDDPTLIGNRDKPLVLRSQGAHDLRVTCPGRVNLGTRVATGLAVDFNQLPHAVEVILALSEESNARGKHQTAWPVRDRLSLPATEGPLTRERFNLTRERLNLTRVWYTRYTFWVALFTAVAETAAAAAVILDAWRS